jgi:hypothetical protein
MLGQGKNILQIVSCICAYSGRKANWSGRGRGLDSCRVYVQSRGDGLAGADCGDEGRKERGRYPYPLVEGARHSPFMNTFRIISASYEMTQ